MRACGEQIRQAEPGAEGTGYERRKEVGGNPGPRHAITYGNTIGSDQVFVVRDYYNIKGQASSVEWERGAEQSGFKQPMTDSAEEDGWESPEHSSWTKLFNLQLNRAEKYTWMSSQTNQGDSLTYVF